MKLGLFVVSAGVVAGLLGCQAPKQALDVEKDQQFCHTRVLKALGDLTAGDSVDYSMVPRNIAPGDSLWTLRPVKAEEWCSGFWPGVLWLDYEATGDEAVKEQAQAYTLAMQSIIDRPVYDHDLGFLMFCSCGNAYRLTGDSIYKDMILRTADSLATLF
ncbi:MAG: glycoside hydrolase family 88 protein, partial [Muribaculaceae bacterium]|nr:glycoside hydrolase family 88 protein [Muribaculaceae bacterium]